MSAGDRYAPTWLTMLQRNWRQWCDGFAAVVPERLRGQLTDDGPIITIDVDSDTVRLSRNADRAVSQIATLPRAGMTGLDLRTALAAYLSKPALLRDSFVLRLPDSTALKRMLSLPIAARGNLSSLLDIELDRQSPVDRADIYHDHRILSADPETGRLEVVWRIVRRKTVDPILEACQQAGLGLAAVAFTGDETLSDGGTFPVDAGAARLLHARRWLVRGLLLLILALLLAIVLGVYVRNQDAANALDLRVNQARIDARTSLRLEHEIAVARNRSELLIREKRRAGVSRLLAEATRLLPNGTWLSGFAYRNGEVRLQGYSNAASSLIAVFDASPIFASAEFRAPLVQAQGPGVEQFDLALKVREGAQ